MVLEPHILHLKIGVVPSVIALHLLFVHFRLYVLAAFKLVLSTLTSLAETVGVLLEKEHTATATKVKKTTDIKDLISITP